MTEPALPPIAFIGFGEAAEAFAKGWGRIVATGLRAYDEDYGLPAKRARATGVEVVSDRMSTLDGAGAVFCLVTADRAVRAAEEAAPYLAPGALWFDGNSCSPGAKRCAAAIVEAVGGRYVDVAIMAPVYPKMHRTPLLIAGPHASNALAILSALKMVASIAGEQVGEASAIKMIRSVMIKGMEALTAECLLAARHAGIEDRVLASLQASNPQTDWLRQTAYNLERMMVHGKRRAAEMREVAATLIELGLPNDMAQATADWQQRIGDLELPAGEESYPDRADAILSGLEP